MITRLNVGSDQSKNWFDVHAPVRGRQAFTARYPNTAQGHKLFIEEMRSFGAKKVHVCMEHTGGYERALALACREAGFIVSIVDGAKIAKFRDSFSSTGAGSDKKSAYLLARYCRERRPQAWFPTPDEFRKLRELVRHRENLVETRSQWLCRAAADVESPLVHAQRQAVIDTYSLMIKELEREIEGHVQAHAELAEAARLLRTIPGIGATSAVRILAEMGQVGNYATAKELALAAGLVPIVVSSGQKVPPGKLPVYGNRELRNSLFYPSLVGKRNGTGVGPFIARIECKGKLKMTAVVAGMRKLCHVIFGVLSSGQPFDPKKAGLMT
jgi:transposase